MKENEIKDNIFKIDNLLNNENELDNYLNEILKISDDDFDIPSSLNKGIFDKVNRIDTKENNIIKFKSRMTNIVKIVACTLLAIIMWETTFSGKVSYATNENVDNKKIETFYKKVDEKLGEVNSFFNNMMKKDIKKEGRK